VDPLRQTLDDRGLADARFPDQHRIVLGATLQNLDRPANLIVAADDWIEFALARTLGEIERVLAQSLALALGFGRLDRLAAAHHLDRGFEGRTRESGLAHRLAALAQAVFFHQGEQQHFRGDELVAPLARLLFSKVERLRQFAAHLHLSVAALDFCDPRDLRLECTAQRRQTRPSALKKRLSRPFTLLQHCQHHMRSFDVGVILRQTQALRIGKCLLKLSRQFVDSHGRNIRCRVDC